MVNEDALATIEEQTEKGVRIGGVHCILALVIRKVGVQLSTVLKDDSDSRFFSTEVEDV